jgi:hypothetical protein
VISSYICGFISPFDCFIFNNFLSFLFLFLYYRFFVYNSKFVCVPWGLIAARPKGVRTPPRTPKKKACGGCTPAQPGVQTPARLPPHAARRLHAYKWREDGRLGVRPRRTGVHGWHACPARLT